MAYNPFGFKLPLTDGPFNSRISSQYSDGATVNTNKNYYAIAFNPGYALQASELNEIQELFFLNQNLTQRSNATWQSQGYKIPFWEGLIPLNPTNVSISNVVEGSSTSTFFVSVPNSWYLWTEATSKMSFWVYKDQSSSSNVKSFSVGNGQTIYIGYNTQRALIDCCPNDNCSENSDDTIRDNSDGSTVGQFNTCGASRLKMYFSNNSADFTAVADLSGAASFRRIFSVTGTSTGITAAFGDGQAITVSV